jgi:RimJ/RimL family protein N-acetyltransferase
MLPTLLTPRLRLRRARPEDAPALARLWRTPRVRRGLWDDAPVTLPGVRAALLQFQRLEAVGLGLWAIEARGDAHAGEAPSTLVGSAGLRPAALGGVEPFVAIASAHRRRGHAAAAVQALAAYAFGTRGLPELVAWIGASNVPAQRLAARLGFAASGMLEGPHEVVHAFVLPGAAHRAPDR